MLVKATAAMCKAINKEIGDKLEYCVENIKIVTLSPAEYAFHAGGDVYDSRDLITKKNGERVFKAILVTYLPQFYAFSRYLTTSYLDYVFRHSDKTYDGFFNELSAELEI